MTCYLFSIKTSALYNTRAVYYDYNHDDNDDLYLDFLVGSY